MTPIYIIASLISTHALEFPMPDDTGRVALRVESIKSHRCVLVEEAIGDGEFKLTLINISARDIEALSIRSMLNDGKAEVRINCDKGNSQHALHTTYDGGRKDAQIFLAPREHHCFLFNLNQSGYGGLPKPGNYSISAVYRNNSGTMRSPPLSIRVIEPSRDLILEAKNIAVVPKSRFITHTVAIEQVDIEGRLYLFYRQYTQSSTQYAYRIAELPGQVFDLKVEGAYGEGGPLTITYREFSYSKFTTKHVINSIDGRPWTAEEEKHWQEKLKKAKAEK